MKRRPCLPGGKRSRCGLILAVEMVWCGSYRLGLCTLCTSLMFMALHPIVCELYRIQPAVCSMTLINTFCTLLWIIASAKYDVSTPAK